MANGFKHGFLEGRDGLRVEYRDYQAIAPVSGPPVLCLHGLTRNLRDFENLAPLLAALGRRVLVPSQRGRGGSDRDPRPERYAPVTYVGDMIALLDQLGVERAVFIGTSMGGLMTMIAATMTPHRIAAAVLNDVGPEIDPAGLDRIRGYVGGGGPVRSWAAAAALCRSINGIAFPDETGDAFWLAFARKVFREEATDQITLDYDPEISKSVAPGGQALADLWPLFDALKPIPTLLVRGEITDILSKSTVAEMQRRKPDLAVASVPRVGHAPFLTELAALEALIAFLRSGAE